MARKWSFRHFQHGILEILPIKMQIGICPIGAAYRISASVSGSVSGRCQLARATSHVTKIEVQLQMQPPKPNCNWNCNCHFNQKEQYPSFNHASPWRGFRVFVCIAAAVAVAAASRHN
jgi:hypothetical protein